MYELKVQHKKNCNTFFKINNLHSGVPLDLNFFKFDVLVNWQKASDVLLKTVRD